MAGIGPGFKHLELNQDQLRRKMGSNGNFNRSALCGNGSYHATLTTVKADVNCPRCLELLATKPHYL